MKNLLLLILICVALFSCTKEKQEISQATVSQKHYFYVAEVTQTGETIQSNIVVVN